MIFRQKRKPAFIHINKTGGTSIVGALGIGPKVHLTAIELKALMGDDWQESFKFAIVRNPWDKVLSHYTYRVKTGRTGIDGDRIPFSDWVARAYGDKDPRYYDNPKMFLPQSEWIKDESGKIVTDFIGRFERLKQDFREISRHVRRKKKLPHANRTDHRHYSSYYDEASMRIVENWFQEDIQRFGYYFEEREGA